MSNEMYHVFHCRRITTLSGACNVRDHNSRSMLLSASGERVEDKSVKIPDYIDIRFTQYNTVYGCQTRDEFCKEYLEKIEKAKLERKPQRNASRIVETIISSSHSFCDDWKSNDESRLRMKAYLEDGVAWEYERHGDVVLSVAYHWDEKTPHVHILSVPLVQYTKKETNEMKLKFSSSVFFGSKGDLIKMHTDFHEQVGRRYGLERGQYGSRATHKELRDYKAWEREQCEKLLQSERLLTEEATKTNEQQKWNSEVVKKVSKREEELLKREYKVGFDSKVLEIKKNEFAKMAERANQGIPRIPVPPITLSMVKISKWVDSVQEHITKTFQALKAAYESMRAMYNKAIVEIQKLRTANKQLHDENVLIKHDLLNKPLAEIQAHREAIAAQKKEHDKKNVEHDAKEQGRSR